ncbi:alpha/beta hydrolase [Flavobacterium sp. TAB 87]|uniref:alpha/beta hydrolase n=1 Tax=Flavobacterium sp. TAB 87 TaxID=1729581 RepID=UPI00076DE383|nr:alpha/beta hydrolase [Flavobacterium sp. TAB 87]KVV15246.1 acetoin dehydrogenase E2 subunit dihydrolipoyllysine-residue acetyltransferase [Flavobacterium sp. TAB 87]
MNLIAYTEDILKDGFEQATLVQRDDYEGAVTATLVRKQSSKETSKAVLYLHGFNDYFFQKSMANEFLKNDFRFYALDLRKYGRSILPHQKVNNVRDLSEYFEEIDRALEIIRTENNTQVILAGHSTGGLIITLYAAARQNSDLFVGLYCNSPFYDMNVPVYQKKYLIPLVATIGKKFPDLQVPGGFSEFYGLSLHQDYHGEWNYDLNWKPNKANPIHAGWLTAITKGHSQISEGVILDKPILILHSQKSIFPSEWSEEMFTGDAILNINDIIKNAQKIKAPQKSIIGVEGAVHDLALSKKKAREIAYKLLFDWLNANII